MRAWVESSLGRFSVLWQRAALARSGSTCYFSSEDNISWGTCQPPMTLIIHFTAYFMIFQNIKSGIGPNNISKIRLLNYPSNDVGVITYFQLFHCETAQTRFELRVFIHDQFLGIWVKAPPLDTLLSQVLTCLPL